MAATYLKGLLAVQPKGPWLLGGWSLGGLVAWEMAQILRREGGEVDLLVLIDTPAPGRTVGQPIIDLDEITDLDLVVEHLVPELDPAAAEALRAEAARLNDLEAVLQAAQRLGALPAGIGTAQVQALLRTYRANAKAARRYEPQPYDGRLLLIRATEGLARLDPLLGWGDLLAGEREIVDAEGDHYTILQGEAVHTMARTLRERLAP
jgi:thioesterase domain-containing protein